jgi:hypothetical protein
MPKHLGSIYIERFWPDWDDYDDNDDGGNSWDDGDDVAINKNI